MRCSPRAPKTFYAYITHGVLSGGAVARISGSSLKELVVTDTIAPTEAVLLTKNIRVLPIAPLIGEAIARTGEGRKRLQSLRLSHAAELSIFRGGLCVAPWRPPSFLT